MTDPHTVKLDQASDGIDISVNPCTYASRLREVAKYLEAIKIVFDRWRQREQENFILRNQMTLESISLDIGAVINLANFGPLEYDEHVEERKKKETNKKPTRAALYDVKDIKSIPTSSIPHRKQRLEPPDLVKALIMQMAMNGCTLNEVPPPTPARPKHEDYEELTSVKCQTQ